MALRPALTSGLPLSRYKSLWVSSIFSGLGRKKWKNLTPCRKIWHKFNPASPFWFLPTTAEWHWLRAQMSTATSEIATPNDGRQAAEAANNKRGLHQPAKPEWRIDILDKPEELFAREDDLRHLASQAIEPNVFHEPFVLFPALRQFGSGEAFRFISIYGSPGGNPKPPMTLRFFLPAVLRKRHRGLPIKALKAWNYQHCFLGTPLVSRVAADQTMEVFFDWLRDDPRAAPVLEIPMAGIDGRVFQHLVAETHRRDLPMWLGDVGARALCKPRCDTFSYIRNAISGQAHKEFNRKGRRLAELGKFEIRRFGPDGDVQKWCNDFLAVESAGWKGSGGSSLGSTPENSDFFRSVLEAASVQRRLMMLGYFVDDKPIAMKCNFLAPPGSFAFKIGYDEKYHSYSPGQLLEIENIRTLCEEKPADWMDSCADFEHPMINRLWTERRTIANLHLATGKRFGHLAVSSLSALKWLKNRLQRRSSPTNKKGAVA